jgi:hypothetical protein
LPRRNRHEARQRDIIHAIARGATNSIGHRQGLVGIAGPVNREGGVLGTAVGEGNPRAAGPVGPGGHGVGHARPDPAIRAFNRDWVNGRDGHSGHVDGRGRREGWQDGNVDRERHHDRFAVINGFGGKRIRIRQSVAPNQEEQIGVIARRRRVGAMSYRAAEAQTVGAGQKLDAGHVTIRVARVGINGDVHGRPEVGGIGRAGNPDLRWPVGVRWRRRHVGDNRDVHHGRGCRDAAGVGRHRLERVTACQHVGPNQREVRRGADVGKHPLTAVRHHAETGVPCEELRRLHDASGLDGPGIKGEIGRGDKSRGVGRGIDIDRGPNDRRRRDVGDDTDVHHGRGRRNARGIGRHRSERVTARQHVGPGHRKEKFLADVRKHPLAAVWHHAETPVPREKLHRLHDASGLDGPGIKGEIGPGEKPRCVGR